MTGWQVIEGDCRAALLNLPAQSVQTCVTSPPYYGLRDYGLEPTTWGDGWVGCLGLEPDPAMFVAHLVEVFAAVRQVLRDDGSLWLNLGDSYAATGTTRWPNTSDGYGNGYGKQGAWHGGESIRPGRGDAKPKDLLGIPWMAAFALRADGWYLRSEIIWAKRNCMPESVGDRPTRAHEHIFLLTTSPRYFYDADAVREEPSAATLADRRIPRSRPYEGDPRGGNQSHTGASAGHPVPTPQGGRNKRSVWTISAQSYPGAHFATFPPKLIEPCILAGSREGDTVLDPFAGAGTTGLVALRHDRSFVGCELKPEYAELARNRIRDDAPLLNVGAEVAA